MTLQRITPQQAHSLWSVASTRRVEVTAAALLPTNTLMQRAGLSIARLVMAMRPHAQSVWLACGPGNNGGDGLEAATQLHLRGVNVTVTWAGNIHDAPPDSQQAHQRLVAAGLTVSKHVPAQADVCVDALLGVGATRGLSGLLATWAQQMNDLRTQGAWVLAADTPSGLHADTGRLLDAQACTVHADATLSLLSLKPGLFTAHGRDVAGEVWLDDLQVSLSNQEQSTAILQGPPPEKPLKHNSHKGSYGDVAVVGGAEGMCGAAVLAASAAMHAGAGRVFVSFLGQCQSNLPELMVRDLDSLKVSELCVVAGCGGGAAIAQHLPKLISQAALLVLDADALNAVATDTHLQTLLRERPAQTTVITPHPLEAARLLGCSSAQVQHDRLNAARALAEKFQCAVVLKGSGTVIAAPQGTPVINPTGNALLARGGTGDVLAGMVGAALAALRCSAEQTTNKAGNAVDNTAANLVTNTTEDAAFKAACRAVYQHGALADQWPTHAPWSPSLLAAAAR